MRHAEHDFLQAHGAAALDDLFQRRDQRFAAIEAETLGALVLDVDELLEAFRLDQLLQDRLLAGRGEGDALVLSLDALLYPRLLLRIGDVHELDAERRAVGPFQDFQHLADGGVFEPQHLVDEDAAVIIGGREAIGFRRQLVVVLERFGEPQRIEVGMQVAAHAVGADHHDGAHRIARRPEHVGVGDDGGAVRRLLLELLFEVFLDGAPVAVQRRDKFAIGDQRPVRLRPRCAFGVFLDVAGIVLQGAEEILPLHAHGGRILLVAGVEVLDVVGVAAVEERGKGKLVVGLILSCHFLRLGASAPSPLSKRIANSE